MANHLDFDNRLIKEINCEIDAYDSEIRLPHRWEQMHKEMEISKKIEQHHREQMDFFAANIDIISKYVEGFQTADAWQAEKANINMNKREEERFHEHLINEESRLTDCAQAVDRKISDTVETMKNHEAQMAQNDASVIRSMSSV